MSINLTGNEFEFEALQQAHNYRRAILRKFAPHLKGATLEVGCGIGQFTQELIQAPNITRLTSLEPDATFHAKFKQLHPGTTLMAGTVQDLHDIWDTIVSVNVLEHIEHDTAELTQFYNLLSPQGALCLFVPAHPGLYSPLDAQLGHFRRYTKPELTAKLKRAGFHAIHLSFFNPIGYLSWLVMCKWLGATQLSSTSVRFFDQLLLPMSSKLEAITHNLFGQSLIAIARKA